MHWWTRIIGRKGLYTDLSREIQEHLDEKIEELVAGGMSREEAAHAARREFGNVTLVQEDSRTVWRWSWLDQLFSDVRYALRALRRSPAFALVAILTLALGIGANTALFSVIDALLLRSLPFKDSARLIAVSSPDLHDANHGGEISYPTFLDWRSGNHSFDGLSAWNVSNKTYTGGDQAESAPSGVVSANLFSVLGVTPLLGRTFLESEDQPGAEQLPVVLSYAFWQSHFGGDATVLGKSLTLDGQKYGVIGVMPEDFQFPVQTTPVELWITIARDLQGKNSIASQRGVSYLSMIARLKSGVEIPQAIADIRVIQDRLNHQHPDTRPRGVTIRPESEEIAGAMRPTLLILLGAVGFVLLIACANVASLLLARATVRRREFTVRSALGATRWMIGRQLLTESVVLAMCGGALGLLLAHWATSLLVATIPSGLARVTEVSIDLRVLAFTFGVALITGLLFGLAPALQVSFSSANRAPDDAARGSSAGPAGVAMRRTLVAAQISIALVLLVGAGLLLRSFERLRKVDPGFRAERVLTFLLDIGSQRHAGAQRPQFVRNLLEATRALPNVKSASAIFGLPLSPEQSAFTTAEIEGRPVPSNQQLRAAFRIIESNYFDCMGIRLLQGRAFTARDEQGERPLAIVNETFARLIFPGENPVGRRIRPNIAFGGSDDAPMREIVGITSDVRSAGIAGAAVPEVYAPQTPTDFIGEMTVVVRTQNDPKTVIPAMRSLVTSMDKELPIRNIKTLDQYVDGSIAGPRFEAILLGLFAGLALLLTTIGLYSAISYAVAQRTREIGIRVALGAQRTSISRMVIRQAVVIVLSGLAVGLLASFAAVRLIRSSLYGIGATDPVTFLVVPSLLLAVALLASYMPARRAMRVDPVVALRHE
jgi:putative ABC transport system permease protein